MPLSPRRPTQTPAAEQVHVQVRHRLASVIAHIQHEPVSPGEAGVLGEPAGNDQQVTGQFCVRILEVLYSGDGLSGDNEHVRRRDRVDVAEGDAAVVLEYEV